MTSHYRVTVTDNEGNPTGAPGACVASPYGVILLADHRASPAHIEHMCAMARDNPGYPYVISAWKTVGETPEGEPMRVMVWSADLVYEEEL